MLNLIITGANINGQVCFTDEDVFYEIKFQNEKDGLLHVFTGTYYFSLEDINFDYDVYEHNEIIENDVKFVKLLIKDNKFDKIKCLIFDMLNNNNFKAMDTKKLEFAKHIINCEITKMNFFKMKTK